MQYQTSLELYFAGGSAPELMKTVFTVASINQRIIGMRGINVPRGVQPFRWTTSSQALAWFFVRMLELWHQGIEEAPIFEGRTQSPAVSLGHLLKKRPDGWLLDAFGYDTNGKTLLSRIIFCRNYKRVLPGPMQIFAKSSFLHPSQLRIHLDGEEVSSNLEALSELRVNLERTWTPGLRREMRVKPPAKTRLEEGITSSLLEFL